MWLVFHRTLLMFSVMRFVVICVIRTALFMFDLFNKTLCFLSVTRWLFICFFSLGEFVSFCSFVLAVLFKCLTCRAFLFDVISVFFCFGVLYLLLCDYTMICLILMMDNCLTMKFSSIKSLTNIGNEGDAVGMSSIIGSQLSLKWYGTDDVYMVWVSVRSTQCIWNLGL